MEFIFNRLPASFREQDFFAGPLRGTLFFASQGADSDEGCKQGDGLDGDFHFVKSDFKNNGKIDCNKDSQFFK